MRGKGIRPKRYHVIELIKLTILNAAVGSAGATSFLFVYYLIRLKLGV